jgi:dCMP deaminase
MTDNYLTDLENTIKGWNSRIDWEHYFMSTALMISSRSSCDRLHVGCVLVRDTRIISMGYNGFLPGRPHESIVRDGHEQATVHAEQNAITDCSRRGISCNGATAYVTHYPCINCFKILAASGIIRVVYLHDYKNDPIVSQLTEIPIEKIT